MLFGLRQLVKQRIARIMRPLHLMAAHDLYLQLQLAARASTARYVEEKMFDVQDFDDKHTLLAFALEQSKVQGHFLEFGVYKGASINFIASRVPSGTTVHGFDSFEGLPDFWRPAYKRGVFDLQGRLPRVAKNVCLHKGWFETSLGTFRQANEGPIAFIHVDCDLYSSTRTIFTLMGEQIVSGTVIAFDEYFNHPGWQHDEHRAFQEFISERGLSYRYLGYTRYDEQVAVMIL
jgi:predicted O-methyltransferase YrrM